MIDNSFLERKREFILEYQEQYVKYIIVSRYTANNEMGREEVIHAISDIRQADYYVQAENNLYSLFGRDVLQILRGADG